MATFVWLVLLPGLAQVQTVPSNAPAAVIEVIRFSWSSQLQNGSGLETGMTGAGGTGPQRPDQVNREMEIQRQQAAGNKQILDELDQKAKRDQLPTLVKGKQTAEKHTYQYTLELKNTSANKSEWKN